MDSKSENPPERWKRFGQHVELMFSGPLATKKEEEKWSYLLIWCGEKDNDIANIRSDVTDEDRKKLKTYFERFSNHLEPKCNPVFSRYKFHKREQTEAETVEKFVTDLKHLARECSFKVIPQYAFAKPLPRHANYDLENNNSTNALRPCCFKLCDLSPNFIWYSSICSTLSTCHVFFPSVTLIKYASSYCKIWLGSMNNARDKHEYKHKWGKIGPSYLLSENSDPSFLLYFFETMLGGEHSGKFSKKFIGNFFSEESA